MYSKTAVKKRTACINRRHIEHPRALVHICTSTRINTSSPDLTNPVTSWTSASPSFQALLVDPSSRCGNAPPKFVCGNLEVSREDIRLSTLLRAASHKIVNTLKAHAKRKPKGADLEPEERRAFAEDNRVRRKAQRTRQGCQSRVADANGSGSISG